MVGKVRDLEVSSDESAEDSDTDEEFETAAQKRERAGNKSRSMFSLFKYVNKKRYDLIVPKVLIVIE